MFSQKVFAAISLVLVCSFAFPDMADARHRGRRHHRSYRSYRGASKVQSAMARAYAEQMRAAAIRAAALRAARAETYRATSELYVTRMRLEKEFRDSPQITSAESNLKESQLALESNHDRVLATLRSNSDYQAAVKAKGDAETRLDALKNTASVSPAWLEAVANRTSAASAVSRIETAAFKSDSEVQIAESRVAAALKSVQDARRQNQSSVRGSPALSAASADVIQARRQMAAAYAAGNASLAAGRGRTSSRSRPQR